ncbi:ParM/StbA family protein [Caloranaerobacter ferrireducens]|uniref:ParM/StbA family protein n=1 Tax=Caloranaerobacter ferrireducens TaxID=1323370 RepID=UPI00084CFB4A|nr:ParM/StbA family protein [Caloranaerobacter ferrireducens]
MNNQILISIDHGNKNMKILGENGENVCFSSGYVESSVEPISVDNLLCYCNKYYSIGNSRFSVIFDKSTNEKFFILSLAGIASVLNHYQIKNANVMLTVGLPIVSFGNLKKKFQQYFVRDNVQFSFNGQDYKISIKNCFVFPQGYSAFLTVFKDFKDVQVVCCDIGGYTADIFTVNKGGKLDVGSATSINKGVITFFRDIQQELLKQDIRISEEQIEETLKENAPIVFDEKIINLIQQKAEQYIEDLLDEIREMGYETKINPMLFIGGGAMLLRKFIEKSNKVGYVEFLDQYANCRGYQLLARKALSMKEGE